MKIALYVLDDGTLVSSHIQTYTSSIFFNGQAETYGKIAPCPYFEVGTNDFTIEMWLKPAAYNQNGSVIFRTCDAAWVFSGINILLNRHGELVLFMSSKGDLWDVVNGDRATVLLELGKWYHLAIVRDAANVTVYLSGKPVIHLVTDKPIYYLPTHYPCIGGQAGAKSYGFIGNVEWMRIMSYAKYKGEFKPSLELEVNEKNYLEASKWKV